MKQKTIVNSGTQMNAAGKNPRDRSGRPMALPAIRPVTLLLLALLLILAGTASAEGAFDYRALIPNGSESAADLTAKQVTFNGNKWYLTAYDETAGTATLFSAGQIGASKFDAASSNYKGSTIEAYLNGLTAEGGSYWAVAPAMVGVDLADVGVTGARLYLLSEDELNTLPESVKRLSPTDSGWKNYWLRTKGPNTWTGGAQAKNCYPASFTGTPLVGEAIVTDTSKAVRPALKLNLARVNFDAAAKTFTLMAPVERTVTFRVVNGAWNDGTDADKTVRLSGYADEMVLGEASIPAVGNNPGSGYKAGSWDVTPDTARLITEDTTYIYSYAEKQAIRFTVTFKVVNGAWADGTDTEKTVTLTGLEGDELKLAANQIPGVGDNPADGYQGGGWDVVPAANTVINQNRTYTYTYLEADKVCVTVTFTVKNGAWNDGTTANRTITLEGNAGDDLMLSEEDIPAAGEKPNASFKPGAWNETPDAQTPITADTTFTYTYAPKEAIRATVTFKVANGRWNDGEGDEASADRVVTLTGLEGDALRLSADQIPAAGSRPNAGYKAGKWGAEPNPDTAIADDTTYTYTYAARVPADDYIDLIPTEAQSMDEVANLRVNFNGFKWYVIRYDEAQNTCTLFAAEKIGPNSWFDDFSNDYSASDIRKLLDGMTAEGGLFEGAAGNIRKTSLTDISPIVDDAALFLLSTEEAEAVPVNVRKYGEEYWLRSRPDTVPGGAVHVYGQGTIGNFSGSSVQASKAVRLALKIDLSKTQFNKGTMTFKARQSVAPPEAATALVYTGEAQALLNSPAVVNRGNGSAGSVLYSIDQQEWSAEIPKATDPQDYTVYYKVEGDGEYEAFTCAEPVAVTIEKVDPEQMPAPVKAKYGQTLADVTDQLPENWSWADDGTTSVGNAGFKTFPANYTPSDEYHREINGQDVIVYVEKADPIAEAPDGLTATYGQTLADVGLANPEGNTDGTWAWTDADTTSVGEVGTQTFTANFMPTDTDNYNSKENVDVTVTVERAANPATVTGTATVTRYGKTVDLADNVTLNGATGLISYEINGAANGCSIDGSVLTSGADTGSVTVDVTIAADDHYNASAAMPITVTISEKGVQTITAEDVAVTYGDTGKSVRASVTEPATGGGSISYAVKDGSADIIDVDADTGALTIKKAGTAVVVVKAAETQTYAEATIEVTVTIGKANAAAALVTANNGICDGTDKPLVTADDSTLVGGTMWYALGENATTEPEESLYTTSIPSKTDVGTYYVWFRAVGDENHLDSPVEMIEVVIKEAEFGTPDFTMPAQLTEIGESAFEGLGELKVVDAHSCMVIGKDAFRDTGLAQIRLPKDCEIDPEAFGDQLICVFAPAGGTTQAYCAGHDNLVFIAE